MVIKTMFLTIIFINVANISACKSDMMGFLRGYGSGGKDGKDDGYGQVANISVGRSSLTKTDFILVLTRPHRHNCLISD